MPSQNETTHTPIELTQPIIEAANNVTRNRDSNTSETWFDETTEFTDDELIVTVTDEFITENTDVSLDELMELNAVETDQKQANTIIKITFKLWMAVRRATRNEFEAIKQGVKDEQNNRESEDNDRTKIEEEYYMKGREEGTKGNDEDPEVILGGRIPSIIEYHRTDGYDGPRHFGNAFNWNGKTEFSPDDAGTIISEVNEIYTMTADEYPNIECEDKNGTVHRLAYWVEE